MEDGRTGMANESDERLHMLCLWLAGSRSRVDSDARFSRYHGQSWKLVESAARSALGPAASQAEDVTQEVFTALVVRLRELPEVRDEIHAGLSSLLLGALDPMSSRRMERWISQVRSAVDRAYGYYAAGCDRGLLVDSLDERAAVLNTELGALRGQGYRLALGVGDMFTPAVTAAPEGADDDDEPELRTVTSTLTDEEHSRAVQLLRLAADGSIESSLLAGMAAILGRLPRLGIPRDGLLASMARNYAIDRLRKLAIRNERSLTMNEMSDEEAPAEGLELEIEDVAAGNCNRSEELARDFAVLMHGPVEEARRQVTECRSASERLRAQRRLEKAEANCRKDLRIIAHLLEGRTQEQIAATEALTRDQVRHRLERITELLQPLREGS